MTLPCCKPERLERERDLSADECAVLDLDAAPHSGIRAGQKIRANAGNVRRELAFTARFSPQEMAEITGRKTGGAGLGR